MHLVASYGVGVIFGLGIMLSGMINPAKVLNFFDLAGSCDPSLAFVMGGALAVTAIGYRLVLRRPAPLLSRAFSLPTKTEVDRRLVGGAALFGIGWGIAGFCPGGSLPAIGTGRYEVFIFTGALIAGILIAKTIDSAKRRATDAAA
ncbi:UNVERIFIED_CONTAM: hypothetical protein GTU68_047648 [Idotea baltica]|nr:hypothetical protein [Idotea baltica]